MTEAKWLIWEEDEMGGGGNTPSSSNVCLLGNTFILLGPICAIWVPHSCGKPTGDGRQLPDHFLWNCVDCKQPFQKLNQLGVWVEGGREERGSGREI